MFVCHFLLAMKFSVAAARVSSTSAVSGENLMSSNVWDMV